MITLRQFSEKTTKDLRRLVERDRQEKTFTTGALEDESSSGVCGERFARTTTRTENPVYPSTPATKFVVEFGEYKFDNTTTGNELAVFTAYTPKTTRIAYSRFGWLPQNTLVRMNLHHGRWFIKSDYTLVRHLAKTTSLIASKGSGPVNIWINDLVSSPVWQVTAWNTWMNGTSTIGSGKEVIIEWFQHLNNGAGRWLITEVQC